MSDAIVCPVCDTYNPHDATHCEVCGERLTPPQPGEEVSPEENVAAMIADETSNEGIEETPLPADGPPEEGDFELEPEEPADEFEEEQFEEDEGGEPDESHDSEPEADYEDGDLAAGANAPEYLYSPVDGAAYPKGSAEYEDGFGPLGEELVADPPEELAPVDTPDPEGMPEGTEADEGGFEHEYSDEEPADHAADEAGFDDDGDLEDGGGFDEVPAAESGRQPSAQFEAAFQRRERQRPAMEPLPSPGTLVEPATLTLYVNREPVHTHTIETDEILIGRRDPVADAYPDLDLSDYDPKSEISRKHAYVYRQNKNHTLYVVTNAGTQLNSDLLEIGDRRPLSDGDVIILSGKFAIKFDVPDQ